MLPKHLLRVGLAFLSTIIIANCGGGGDGGTGTQGSIDLSLSPSSGTAPQGGSVTSTVTLTRIGGFTGAVSFDVTGEPSGLTGTVINVATTGTTTTATVTLDVGTATAVGTYPLVVHATGSGVAEVTRTYTLTVTASGNFALGVIPAGAITIAQGGTDNSKTITIARNNYAPNITLSAEGLPSGVTASFAGNPTGGTSSVMTLTATGSATITTSPVTVTIRGTGPAALLMEGSNALAVATVDATTTITVNVTAAAPVGNFTLTTTPATTVSVTQGLSGNVTVNINRTGGNTSSIAFTATGTLPTGMTLGFAPTPTTTNSTVLTIGTTASTPLGTTSIVIRGNTAGLGEQTVNLNIVVAPAGNFTLSTALTSASLTQGQNGTVTVNINRTGGNTSSITLTETHSGALPTGMTLGFAPSPTTANSSTLTITTTASTPVGSTPIVIRGNTPGLGEQTVNLTINVTASGGGTSVTVSFASCQAFEKPAWVAFQNGTATWVVVTGVNDVYTFTINAGKGGLTYVLLAGSGSVSSVIVQYMSQAEWTAGTVNICGVPPTPTGRNLTGTVTGLGVNDLGHASFGGKSVNFTTGSGGFTMFDAPLGMHDYVIYSHPQTVVAAFDRVYVSRNEDPMTGFGTRNMQTDGVTPANALITISGGFSGETYTQSNSFYSRAACEFAPLYFAMAVTGTQFNVYGVPSPLADERHGITIEGSNGFDQFRSVTQYVNALTPRAVTMGSPPSVTGGLTDIGTSYSILRRTYNAAADHNGSFTWSYNQKNATKAAQVTASFAYFGSSAIDMKIGEYTGLAGWQSSWAPQKGQAAFTSSTMSGTSGTGGICSGLQRIISATITGEFPS